MTAVARRPIVTLFEGKETPLRNKYDKWFRLALPKLRSHPEILRVIREMHGLDGNAPRPFSEITRAKLDPNLSLPAHAAYAVGLMALVNSRLPRVDVTEEHLENVIRLLPVFTREEREVMFLRASIPLETTKAVDERRNIKTSSADDEKARVRQILDAAGFPDRTASALAGRGTLTLAQMMRDVAESPEGEYGVTLKKAERLTEDHFEALELIYGHGLSAGETAEKLALTKRGVDFRLGGAYARLRVFLQKLEVANPKT